MTVSKAVMTLIRKIFNDFIFGAVYDQCNAIFLSHHLMSYAMILFKTHCA